ncbi:MAG: LysM peptidoglycan-binding domain-containing protein [Bacillota bacterium]
MKKTIIALSTAAMLSTGFSTYTQAASHTVQSGDTLSHLAKKYSVSVKELKNWNNLNSDLIRINQRLEVGGKSASPAKASANAKTYVVKSGDFLSKIGKIHGVSVSSLKSWNGLSSDLIFPGQKLKVSANGTATPAKATTTASSQGGTYTVVSGDTLSHIAKRYGVTVSQIKSNNGLSSDIIRVGQKLSISKKATTATAAPAKQVTTKVASSSNDSVGVINEAKRHLGTPYVWGGAVPSGFDCSGFIYYVYKQAGMNVSRTNAAGLWNETTRVSNPQPGDLVFFSNTYKPGISHVGIYLGNNEFIHAGNRGIEVTSLSNSYWNSKITGYTSY